MSSIGGDDLLAQIETKNPKLGQLFRRYIIPAINNLGTNIGASPNGYVQPPAPPEGLVVNPQGPENVQFTVQHNAPVQKGVEYFTEVATNPSFSQARVEHHGASRAPVSTMWLPTKDSSGNNHSYYFRSYAQMPGSQRSGYSPSVGPITMTGATQADHTPSTGSGTAAANGSQPGQGWGDNLQRPAVAPKRTV